ncbi:MAG: small acid-soluble spore protein SspI [Bacilli bacterium]|nr:small acid-soluble spore protein SspI [Bacilli bacterium]
MDIDIRKYIKDNFKDSKKEDIRNSIDASIKENDEVTLPGLGVFFEILWNNSDDQYKEKILDILKSNI